MGIEPTVGGLDPPLDLKSKGDTSPPATPVPAKPYFMGFSNLIVTLPYLKIK